VAGSKLAAVVVRAYVSAGKSLKFTFAITRAVFVFGATIPLSWLYCSMHSQLGITTTVFLTEITSLSYIQNLVTNDIPVSIPTPQTAQSAHLNLQYRIIHRHPLAFRPTHHCIITTSVVPLIRIASIATTPRTRI